MITNDLQNLSDIDLIKNFKNNGCEKSFNIIYKRYNNYIFYFAQKLYNTFSYLDNSISINDCNSDIYYEFLKYCNKEIYCNLSNLKHSFYLIYGNLYNKKYHYYNSSKRVINPISLDQLEFELNNDVVDNTCIISKSLKKSYVEKASLNRNNINVLIKYCLIQACSTLTEQEKSIINLIRKNYLQKDIAKKLNITEGYVSMLKNRAIKKIKKNIK